MTEEAQLNVPWLRSLSSTGVNKPVLVLNLALLDRESEYLLQLHTEDHLTATNGTATYLIQFSDPPIVVSILVYEFLI